jgi:predicted ribosomally synthesized peptide with nif11-like leader
MNAELFIQKMKEDQEFALKVLTCTTKEQVVEEAKAVDIDLREEEIDQINQVIKRENLNHIDQSVGSGQLVAKMIEDQEFVQRVLNQKDAEEVIEVAGEAGLFLTEEDVLEAERILGINLGALRSNSGDLSEEDLEQVAGGTIFTSITEVIISSLVTLSTIYASLIATAVVTLTTQLADDNQ